MQRRSKVLGSTRAQTFSNIFAIIEPDLFTRCLAEHIGAIHPARSARSSPSTASDCVAATDLIRKPATSRAPGLRFKNS